MEVRYGVDVSNKFDIIGFNDDAAEAAKQKDELRKTKKAVEGEKPKLGSNKQNTKKSTPYTETKGKQNDQIVNKKEVQGKDSYPPERSNRGGRGNREYREGRDNKENNGERKPFRRMPKDQQENKGGDENVPPEFREKPEGSNRFNRFDDGERGRGRGRGGFRSRGNRGGGFGRGGERGGSSSGGGGGFGAPFERSGKRDFDRHSGSDKTGVKAVDKREGGGRRNWGSFKDDIKNIEESQQMTTESTEPAENWNQNEENPEPQESSNEPPTPGAPETVNEEDSQPKQMTLKEYQASQKKNRLKNQFQIRKAGEGVDNSQWKDGLKIKKPVNPPKQTAERRRKNSESEDEESDEDHEDRRNKKKNTLNIEITFNDANRGRGGRGGRRGGGGGRGGPGRGFYRGNFPRGGGGGRGGERKYREAAPRVDDETDFPSLVKSAA